jgi:hypothetical protein
MSFAGARLAGAAARNGLTADSPVPHWTAYSRGAGLISGTRAFRHRSDSSAVDDLDIPFRNIRFGSCRFTISQDACHDVRLRILPTQLLEPAARAERSHVRVNSQLVQLITGFLNGGRLEAPRPAARTRHHRFCALRNGPHGEDSRRLLGYVLGCVLPRPAHTHCGPRLRLPERQPRPPSPPAPSPCVTLLTDLGPAT